MSHHDDPMDPMLRLKCEWSFKSNPRADREGWYSPEAIAHPAKMDIWLARALTNLYSKPGDVLIDPMSGVGTNVVEPFRMGRNVVAIELERHFAEMQSQSVAIVETRLTVDGELTSGVRIYQGNAKDARELLSGEAFKSFGQEFGQSSTEADGMITSPPFGEQNHKMGQTDEAIRARYPNDCHYSDNPENIGNMAYGKLDGMITSPPFGDTVPFQDPKSNAYRRGKPREAAENASEADKSYMEFHRYSGGPDNIGSMPYGSLDGMITSPPFANANTGGKGFDGVKEDGSNTEMYANLKVGRVAQALSEDPENLDNIKDYGAVLNKPEAPAPILAKGKNGKPTFLGELAAILAEVTQLIKPGGIAVIHTKDSVKKGERVRMGADVARIMAALGFELEPCPECGSGKAHTHRRRLSNPSFWVNQRVGKWLADNVTGVTLNRTVTGIDPKDGALLTKNELFGPDGEKLTADQIRRLAVQYECPYALAGYFEDILVFTKTK